MSVSTLTITFGGQLGVASQWPAALEAILMDGPWGISIACSVEVVQLWIDTYIAQRERERALLRLSVPHDLCFMPLEAISECGPLRC